MVSGTDNALWKVRTDGTQQSKPGNNTTASSPVVLGNLVFFRGTDNKLWQMNTDGTGQNQINGNTTKDTPFVTSDGWVYFQGTDNALWKVRTDGTQQSKPGNNTTNSTPFVTSDGWIWFQGTDNALWKVRTDGTQQSKPGNNTTASSPVVLGTLVFFRGTDNKLWQMNTDGTGQINLGSNTTLSTPTPTANSVYFRGTDNALWRYIMLAGTANAPNCASTFSGTTAESNNLNLTGDCTPVGGATPAIVFAESRPGPLPAGSQYNVGNNTTKDSPFVTSDGWVYFQGTDNAFWKVRTDGTQQSKPGNNTTNSTPFVTSDRVDMVFRAPIMRCGKSEPTAPNNRNLATTRRPHRRWCWETCGFLSRD